MKIIRTIKINTISKLIFLLFVSLLLSSCAMFKSTPTKTVELNIHAVNYLNPDIHGKADPVLVTIYQLKNTYNFKQADYKALSRNSAAALNDSLIDKKSFNVRPHSNKTVSFQIPLDVKYLGFVASYRNINNGRWRSIVKVNSGTSTTYANIHLETRGFTAKVNKNHHFWEIL